MHQRLPVKKARRIAILPTTRLGRWAVRLAGLLSCWSFLVALVPFAFVVFFVLGSTVGSL